ncbi:non-ribosomal peptide synthetase [Paenibacillus tepidiphilus]|uniref:non-ribosomal peptide synthetase n=1 Tax=Paenibacillus tepidiphilus TaxID=2608683 RepID=UPI001239A5EA|nr:non-ribosomal peptide synthetase [Paenibacillus tepidiphilus]
MSKLQLNLADLKLSEADYAGSGPNRPQQFRDEDIAVIGIACKIAGSGDAGQFWESLREGRDAIRPFPEARKKNLQELYHAGYLDENTAMFEGGYLDEVDVFDYSFFHLSPNEANLMDPNQRMFLQTAWTAIEDAGYGGGRLAGSSTGVYVGFGSDMGEEYKRLIAELSPASLNASIPGNIHSMIASRIAYLLDLKGPSMLVDTACSSSLVAVHLACRALRQGECDFAVAGGVKLSLLPVKQGSGGGLGVGSSDDRTRTFDDKSDGTGGGEGVVAVLLKPLKRAVRDRDHIYAVVKGSAVNNDGTSAGITSPNSLAQEDVLARAWADAGIHPERLEYIEAHGTGTKLGDPVEIDGIRKAFRRYTGRKQFCGIGSVKTNIGHLDHCAGIAGFLKAVLSLKHKELPASLHFTEPNARIAFMDSPVYVNERLRVWESGGAPRLCGVSSFGLSGTNCHVVLEEAPLTADTVLNTTAPEDSGELTGELALFSLSARSETALSAYLEAYRSYLQDEENRHSLRDLCYTANTGRGHYACRAAVLCSSRGELAQKLAQLQESLHGGGSLLSGEIAPGVYYGRHRTVSLRKEKEAGDLTVDEQRELSRESEAVLQQQTEYDRKLMQTGRLYVAGADIAWERLYENEARYRVPAPVYPFERHHCWVVPDEGAATGKSRKPAQAASLHPLLDQRLAETENQAIFVTSFSVERHWVLSEHVVAGRSIVPGTAYLEMVQAALQACGRSGEALELRDILFVSPLIVDQGETREVQTILRWEEEEIEFTVLSCGEPPGPAEERSWIRHAQGKASYSTGSGRSVNMDELRSQCRVQEITIAEDAEDGAGAFEFGPRWNALRRIEAGTDRVLAELSLSRPFRADLEQYRLHPALLDAAVGVTSQSLGTGLFLPLTYRKLRIYDSLPEHFYSYAVKKQGSKQNGELLTVDVLIMDDTGRLLLEIEDYTVKRVRAGEVQAGPPAEDRLYHRIAWTSVDSEQGAAKISASARIWPQAQAVIMFTDESPLAASLVRRLRGEGQQVIEVKRGEGFARLGGGTYICGGSKAEFARLFAEEECMRPGTLLYLWGADPWVSDESLLLTFLHLTQAVTGKLNAELLVIARSAYEVTGTETLIMPEHAALYGLAKVAQQEDSGLACRCIDVDGTAEPEDVLAAMAMGDSPYLLALRDGKCYAEELQWTEPGEPADSGESAGAGLTVRDGGVYVITGGTGGLALEVGKRLASRASVHLAFIARTALPPKEAWATADAADTDPRAFRSIQAYLAMESAGAVVEYIQADMADEESLDRFFTGLRHKAGGIHGVIHAAGNAGAGVFALKEDEGFCQVLLPKIQGTRILDKLTEQDDLDFLLLFSSVSSVFGGPGQSDYTAANAFMDAYAEHRNRSGKKTIAIEWASWSETGMAVDYKVDLNSSWFRGLRTGEALDALEEILKHPAPRMMVGRLNYTQAAQLEAAMPVGLSAGIRSALGRYRNRRSGPKSGTPQRRSFSIQGRGSGIYSDSERTIAGIWAEVLGHEQVNLYDNFYELGGDSLLAGKIVAMMNNTLTKKTEIGDLFRYLTVEELAGYVDDGAPAWSRPAAGAEPPQTGLPAQETALEPAGNREYYLATSAQRQFYLIRQMAGESTLNNLCSAMILSGPLDVERLENALQQVVKRQSSLRTSFEMQGEELVQKVLKEAPFELEFADADNREYREYIREFVRPFDLNAAPLFRARLIRVSAERHLFMLDVDHIIADGASIGILLSDIIQLYSGQELPELPVQYTDYALWLNERLQGAELDRQEQYWLNLFHDEWPVLELPTDSPRPPEMNYAGDVYNLELGEEVTAKVKTAASGSGVTLFMLLFAAYAVLLAKYANKEELVIGTPSAGRERKETEPLVGLFINTLALRSAPSGGKRFADYLQEVKALALEAYEHAEYPHGMLLQKLHLERDASRNLLFDVQFISQNFAGEPLSVDQLQFEPMEAKVEAVHVDLTLIWYERDGRLRFRFEYATQLFTERTIARLGVYFEHLLGEIISDPSRPIGQISLVPGQQQEELLTEMKGIPIAVPQHMLVHQLFERQAEAAPDNIAVICGGRSFTYKELNDRANSLACALRSFGLAPDDRVGLLVERTVDRIASMLAVMKAGAAYVPMEPEYPQERLAYIINDSGMALLMAPSHLSGAVAFEGPVIDITDESLYTGGPAQPECHTAPHNLAYILYTSGSTGMPKGVMVEHRNVVHYISSFRHEFTLSGSDVILQQASYAFDVSVEEIFPILSAGGRIVIIQPEELLDIRRLQALIREHRVTLLSTSPFVLNELNQLPPLDSVRIFISGGDVLKGDYVSSLIRYAQVYNTYGPTEGTVCAAYYRVEAAEPRPLPIGRPIANTAVYIMNASLEPQPPGVPGEICIAGGGVARGYLNQPALTNRQFILHPWKPGERLYKSGDLGRYLPDGSLQFLGRIDQQLKIRGYRIEPGEIEAALLRHPSVTDSIVTGYSGITGTTEIAAYYVSDREVQATEWKDCLKTALPEYMIPGVYIRMAALPLTANGKVNRRELPLPDRGASAGLNPAEPSTPTEQKLVQMWSETLQKEGIGTTDDFFLLGGQSLLAMKLLYLINKEWQVEMGLRDFFRASTVRGLAAWIENAGGLAGPEAPDNRDGLATPFNLRGGPPLRTKIIRTGAGKHVLYMDMHHIITDGLSQDIIMSEFAELYAGRELPELPLQYKDYASWQRSLAAGGQYREQEQFWLGQFAEPVRELRLPLDYPRPLSRKGEGGAVSLRLGFDTASRLKRFAIEQDTTVFMLLFAIYNILLGKISGQEDIVVGVPVSGRSHASLNPIVGMFVNTLAIRNRPKSGLSAAEFVREVKERFLLAYTHQDYPFEALVGKLNVSGEADRNPLFDTMFSFANEAMAAAIALPGLSIAPCETEYTGAQFDLTVVATMMKEDLELRFQYDTELFKAETVQSLTRDFLVVLEAVLSGPAITIGEILLDNGPANEVAAAADAGTMESIREEDRCTAESAEIRQPADEHGTAAAAGWDWNKLELPLDKPVHILFEEQAEATPESVALIYAGQVMTYRELNRRANLVAHTLLELGTRREQIVAIVMERSFEVMIGMLGILKAGAAFLPIHHEDPAERIHSVLADTGAELVLTHRSCRGDWLDDRIQALEVDILCGQDQDYGNPGLLITPADLAYMITTSGSTGKPKGVLIEHGAFTSRVVWVWKQLALTGTDTLLSKGSYTFDASLLELFGGFVCGGRLVLLEAGYEKDARLIIDAIEEHGVTATFFLPTAMSMFLAGLSPGASGRVASLRSVMVGGEQLMQEQAREFFIKVPGASLINLYGPTEACIFATAYNCSPQALDKRIPIGYPVGSTQAYILDDALRIVPDGQTGELCLSGPELARGYWNRDELNAEKFIASPFAPGERLYRTGDLAQRLPGGEILCLGRTDNMVKIKGYRIEPGEIEDCLLQHPAIGQAAVIDCTDDHGHKYLAAYLLTQADCTVKELREFLKRSLPEYMVPAKFFALERVPFTSGGKLDRKAIRSMGAELPSGQIFVEPAGAIELKLAALWAELFRGGAIGAEDHFFELGGDSLMAYRWSFLIEKLFGVEVRLHDFFRFPTLRSMAEHLAERMNSAETSVEDLAASQAHSFSAPIPKAPASPYYPASSAQMRLFILHELNKEDLSYNLPGAMLLEGSPDWGRVERTLNRLIRRHESLRTSFDVIDGVIVQNIHDSFALPVEYMETDETDIGNILTGKARLQRTDKPGKSHALSSVKIEKSERRRRGD